jgi:SAM-dependent methyltransferase
MCRAPVPIDREAVMDLLERRGPTNRHPWERARASFFRRIVKSYVPLERPIACMDVGCGDGWFLGTLWRDLPHGSKAYGLDTALDAATIAAVAPEAPGVTFVREEPNRTFDFLCVMDVCEHVEDDHGFLSGLVSRRLCADGRVLFTVPAWPVLFSAHDRALRHFRRYTPRSAKALIAAAGLEPCATGGLFHSLVLSRGVEVARERWKKPAPPPAFGIGGWNAGPLITEAIAAALSVDQTVSRAAAALRIELPGLSWWAICRRR